MNTKAKRLETFQPIKAAAQVSRLDLTVD